MDFSDQPERPGLPVSIEKASIWVELHENLFCPYAFFSAGNLGNKKNPGSFAFVLIFLSAAVHSLWVEGYQMIIPGAEGRGGENPWLILFGAPLITALAAVVILRLTSLFLHPAIFLTGSSKGGIDLSYKVVCYSAAASLFLFLPLIGPPAAAFWGFYLVLAGMRKAHELSWLRLAIIFVVAFLLFNLFCVTLFALLLAGAFVVILITAL